MKPVVDRLKKSYEGKVAIIVMNVSTDQKAIQKAADFGVGAVPTFVFLDSHGTRVDTLVGVVAEKDFAAKLDSLK
jgi:thioredoxin-like negative regulator of GroEL